MFSFRRWLAAVAAIAALSALHPSCRLSAEEPSGKLLLREDFETGAERWAPFDPAGWKIVAGRDGHVFSQFAPSQYQPPHRSPVNIALLKGHAVSSFQLDVQVRSTVKDYNHRDVCLVFGYQDPAHFYYVHLGKRSDDHAHQIFIVKDAPRTKISTRVTEGVPWDDQWHHVRIIRNASQGSIAVYFDDLQEPIMTAQDKTFAQGWIGIGTFDDTADFDELELRGEPFPSNP